jgi:hypothetical protein
MKLRSVIGAVCAAIAIAIAVAGAMPAAAHDRGDSHTEFREGYCQHSGQVADCRGC